MAVRLMYNGDKIAISPPYPDSIDGYERDPHNANLWHPVSHKCSKREEFFKRKSCGATHKDHICTQRRRAISPIVCVTCTHADGGEPVLWNMETDRENSIQRWFEILD